MNVEQIGCEVVTSGPEPILRRFKYHLSPAGDSWGIWAIERECGVCASAGSDPPTLGRPEPIQAGESGLPPVHRAI